jgi:hypothetical protein
MMRAMVAGSDGNLLRAPFVTAYQMNDEVDRIRVDARLREFIV